MTTRQVVHATPFAKPLLNHEVDPVARFTTDNDKAFSVVPLDKPASSALHESALPAGVLVLDERGVIRFSNAAAEDLLDSQLTGELWRDVVGRFFKLHAPADEDELTLIDGRRVSIRTCPRNDGPGQILLLNDVTEVVKLREQVKRQQRLTALGEVSASLAHQIRTPLATALLYLSHVEEDTAAEQALASVSRVRGSLANIEALVRDMLLFVRGEVLDARPIRVGALFESLAQCTHEQLAQLDVELSVSGPRAPVALLGNEDALLSVLQNLVTNAAEAGAKHIRVQCEDAGTRDPQVIIRIEDDGKGIPEAVARHVFDPFFTTRSGGTGLGLSVARNVIRAHGGDIEIDTGEAGGCTMIVHLPAMAAVVCNEATFSNATARGREVQS